MMDAVVVGAGPAGSTLARDLALDGLYVMLIDKEPIGRSRACGGFLGPELKPSLERMRIERNYIPVVEVTGAKNCVLKTRLPRGAGMAVDRARFDAYLVQEAVSAGVVVLAPSTLVSSARSEGLWTLEIADPNSVRTIQSRFLIYATGRRSVTKKSSHGSRSAFYACKAIYEGVNGSDDEVVLHFVKKGHVGLNPLGHDVTTLCLYTDESNIKACKGDLDTMMRTFIQQNTKLAAHMTEARRVTPWQTCQAQPDGQMIFFRDGAFYVGDAVSMVHPIIGGGIPIAIQSAQLLASEIMRGLREQHLQERIARDYEKKWKSRFLNRIRFAAVLGHIERSPFLTDMFFRCMNIFAGLFPIMVQFSRPEL